MNYRYDQLHRIAAAHASKWEGIWTTTEGSYNTSYAYDGNGNIQNLYRNNLEATTIDELHYHYDPVKKNRLDVVKDGGTAEGLNNQQPYEYKYDQIGNLTQNLEDGIEDIEWNIYGKVEKVSKTNGTLISYRYDGTGNRILKEVRTTTTVHTNFYLRDATGTVMAIYEDTRPINSPTTNITLKEIPIYGSSRLGQYRPKTDTKKTALGQRIYEFSNHLGNVLVTLTDNKVPQTDGTYESVVVSASDYYPFGMAMAERTYQNSEYRFGFNGKENDTDFGSHIQDYGFRLYSAAEARFLSVDPLADSYPWNSVYSFAEGSPIENIDLDGLEKYNYRLLLDKDGKTVIGVEVAEEASWLWRGWGDQHRIIMPHGAKRGGTGEIQFKTKEELENYVIGNTTDQIVRDDYEQSWYFALELLAGKISGATSSKLVTKGKTSSSKSQTTANAKKRCGCFTEDTKIFTDTGYVNIQEVVLGMRVAAYDTLTGKTEFKEVVTLYSREFTEVYKIYFGGEFVEATHEHPFYINGKWVDAEFLKIGDSLLLYSGNKVIIDSIIFTKGNFKVYNFTVEDFHNYYVSKQAVLVHNNNPCNFSDPHSRHKGASVKMKTSAKEKNSVYDGTVDIKSDVKLINEGKFTQVGEEMHLSNGRVYGSHAPASGNGDRSLFPIRGTGIIELNRGEFKVLGVLNEHGISDKSTQILINMKMDKTTIQNGTAAYLRIKANTQNQE